MNNTYKKIKDAYRANVDIQIPVFILFTSVIVITVLRQLFYKWTSDYLYPTYTVVYLLEACYFLFGYDLFSQVAKTQSKWLSAFLSFILALMCSMLFLFKGIKGATSMAEIIWNLQFALHPFVVWCVTFGIMALIKIYYSNRKKSKLIQTRLSD